MRLAAVLTCHNRVTQTLACVESLLAQDRGDAAMDVYLVDDGSTDGTGDAVAQRFPDVTVIEGDGTLFWNGGMRVAFGAALTRDYDHYLWLNDDIVLDAGAVQALLDTHAWLQSNGHPPALVVGAMRDPRTGALTYGGVHRTDRWRPLRFQLIEPGPEPRPCETMNGNFVLVPRAVAARVGNLDPAYQHSMGDYDYGLRARGRGCEVWMAPGTVGTCSRNPAPVYGQASVASDLRSLKSLKGLPPSPWRVFTRRWGGPLWPLYFASPYLRRGVSVGKAWLRRERSSQTA